MTTVDKEIKDAIKNKKLVIGTDSVLKGIKRGSLVNVIYASNCPEGIKKDLEHYKTLAKIEIKEFGGGSTKLGEMCAKPFSVLMVGIIK